MQAFLVISFRNLALIGEEKHVQAHRKTDGTWAIPVTVLWKAFIQESLASTIPNDPAASI